jgi:hypothetical protein
VFEDRTPKKKGRVLKKVDNIEDLVKVTEEEDFDVEREI